MKWTTDKRTWPLILALLFVLTACRSGGDMSLRIKSEQIKASAGQTIALPFVIGADEAYEFSAFGLDISYPVTALRYAGIKKGNLTEKWNTVDGHEVVVGSVRVGGMAGRADPIKNVKRGCLFYISFRVLSDIPADIIFDHYVDGLAKFKPQPMIITVNDFGLTMEAKVIEQYRDETLADDRGWNWSQWNDNTFYRGLHHKFDRQLTELDKNYGGKINRILDTLRQHEAGIEIFDSNSLRMIEDKLKRLSNKWRSVKAEIEGRSLGFFGPGLEFDREYHGTDYYIDLDAGNNGADGLGTGTAWLTLAQYTSVTARSAGDIAYVRANTDQVNAAVINCDEDGNADNLIYIIGCDSVTNDPWSDSSDVKPIIDHNAGARYFSIAGDNFWQIERMVFKNSIGSVGNFVYNTNYVLRLIDCEFLDAGTLGARANSRGTAYFEGCTFSNNTTYSFRSIGGNAQFASCVFDAGAGGCVRGLDVEYDSLIEATDCDFGQTNAFSGNDIWASYGSKIYLRNCKHNDDFVVGAHAVVFEEDTDGVYGAHRMTYGAGTVTKDTGITRVGGADSSAKMEPKSAVGSAYPLPLNDDNIINSPFKIWTAAALTTITVYIRSLGTWGTYPVAAELYLEASYLDHAVNASRTKVQSNDVLNHASDWKAFDVTFTPLQAGFVYLNVYLKLYEDAGDGCYVDIKPVVS